MKKGDIFEHKTFLRDRIVDGRRTLKAQMKITMIRKGLVYYTYADAENNKGLWYMPKDQFEEVYGK